MENLKFPPVPKELIEELERRFPDRAPNCNDEYSRIMFLAGEVSVVRFLRHQFNLQTETILEKK